MYLQQFYVESLGHYSYLIGSVEAGEAFVVDPKRDIAEYTDAAAKVGLRITHILETHLHNDYISGSRELVAATGATIGHSAAAQLSYEHQPLREGDTLLFGELEVRVLETPGHTPEHLCYVVYDKKRSSSLPVLILTGGDLLVGSVGRPDLLGAEMGRRLAPQLYDSLQDKILPVGDGVQILPTHGAGSSCGASISTTRTSTIGYEKATNHYLQHKTQEAFVKAVLSGQPTIPAYYARMRRANEGAARVLGQYPTPPPLTPAALQEKMAGGEALVLDARDDLAYGAGHIPGAINIGLGNLFTTWVGSVLPADKTLYLVLSDDADLEEAMRQLLRIGYEQVGGYLQGGMSVWSSEGLPVEKLGQLTVQELKAALAGEDPPQVIDVRAANEWQEGYIKGATHIVANDIQARLDELPRDRRLAVICGGGYRSSVAAGLLQRAGFQDLHNVTGGMEAWNKLDYPTEGL